MVPFLPLGRVAGVQSQRAGSDASAAGGPRDYHQPCEVLNRVSCVIHAGGEHESVSMRLLWASQETLRVHRLSAQPVHEPHQRSVARPHRPADSGAAGGVRRDVVEATRRVVAGNSRTRDSGPCHSGVAFQE